MRIPLSRVKPDDKYFSQAYHHCDSVYKYRRVFSRLVIKEKSKLNVRRQPTYRRYNQNI